MSILKQLRRIINMKFRPLHDRVLIEVLDSEEKTSGGIIIPDTAKEEYSIMKESDIMGISKGKK